MDTTDRALFQSLLIGDEFEQLGELYLLLAGECREQRERPEPQKRCSGADELQ